MRLKTIVVAVLAGLLAIPSPALAITAGDVVEKMKGYEDVRFIAGAVDMYSHLMARNGSQQKADCAVTWFFETDGALREVLGVFENYRDKDAVALIEILINRHCSKADE